MMFAEYFATMPGDITIPPVPPGGSENHGDRTTPTMRTVMCGPVYPRPGWGPAPTSSFGVGRSMINVSPTVLW